MGVHLQIRYVYIIPEPTLDCIFIKIIRDDEQDDEEHDVLRRKQERGQSAIIEQCTNFTSHHLIDARLTSTRSLLERPNDNGPPNIPTATNLSRYQNLNDNSGPTKYKLIAGSLVGTTDFHRVYEGIDQEKTLEDSNQPQQTSAVPTLVETARKIALNGGPQMDEKQYIAYEVLCCTFLLGLLNDDGDNNESLHTQLHQALSSSKRKKTKQLIKELKIRGGDDQLLMFLTGPAGAGKSTAVKVTRQFCFDFSMALGSIWTDSTFLFTAYTGSAAMIINGITICKAAFLCSDRALTEADKRMWMQVKVLIIDEISFMDDRTLQRLDQRLKQLRDRSKPFGGFSIVFAGDFRQIQPRTSEDNLIFSRSSSNLWINSINNILILNNEHRFKEDPEWGKMMTKMWEDDLTRKNKKTLNTRKIKHGGVTLPTKFDGEGSFACPINKERNAIHAANFRRHVLETHPDFDSDQLPPEHTIVIEAQIRSSNQTQRHMTIDNVLRHQIITTCGDNDVKWGRKLVDPALCLYVGSYLMCVMENSFLTEEVPRGNGTLCRLVSMKLKNNATSHTCKKYYGKKVWTVCAKDVQWIEVEHVIKTEKMIELEKDIERLTIQMSTADEQAKEVIKARITNTQAQLISLSKTRRFKMEPEKKAVSVKVKTHPRAFTKVTVRCQMTQFSVNLADATTGHKLQGMTKDVLIITSWPPPGLFTNWEYTVLSRVRTLKGLYLFQEIDMDKSFAPSPELKAYFQRARQMEKRFLQRRKQQMIDFYTPRTKTHRKKP